MFVWILHERMLRKYLIPRIRGKKIKSTMNSELYNCSLATTQSAISGTISRYLEIRFVTIGNDCKRTTIKRIREINFIKNTIA